MPSIDKLRHNIRHAVSLSAFSPNLIHRIRYFFSLYSYFPRLLEYNDENALSCVISMAYYGALKYYYLPVREMPAGRGFADLVFLPKRECPEMPAMLIELKWDQTADSAIKQIKERKYTEALEVYDGDILLIGLNYSKKRTRHECVIEKVVK